MTNTGTTRAIRSKDKKDLFHIWNHDGTKILAEHLPKDTEEKE